MTAFALDAPDDFAVLWHVDPSYYGIAADGVGGVWLGGSGLRSLDATDGTVTNQYDLDGAYVHGVTVGPEGLVYAAVPGREEIVVVQPGLGEIASHVLTLGPEDAVHPKGVAIGADGSLYAVNRVASDVRRIAPDGAITPFGGDVLAGPYAYNGDLTGLTVACVLSGNKSWSSGPLDAGHPLALWLDASWEALVPPGATLEMSYRVDAGPWRPVGPSGAFLGDVGQRLWLRATLSAPEGVGAVTLVSVTVRYLP